ncbi:MAG: GNAT family N-acetyltransferase [Opitutales bacterium]
MQNQSPFIRPCSDADIPQMFAVINDSAEAYRGKIPADVWHEPYMPLEELRGEIAAGVNFSVFERDGEIVGAMGIQDVQDVALIRHAYIRTSERGKGVGGLLLAHLLKQTDRPVLIGTWKAATWAVSFYEKHGFTQVDEEEKNRLLRTYWTISERQVETSTVLKQGLGRSCPC